jgi:hypothetical protein
VLYDPEGAVDEALMLARPLAARSGHEDFGKWCDDYLQDRDLSADSAIKALRLVWPAGLFQVTPAKVLRRLDDGIASPDPIGWAHFVAGFAALQLISSREQSGDGVRARREEAHRLAQRACGLLEIASSNERGSATF